MFPLCQGIALFATKVHQLSYCMGSHFTHNPLYSTVYNALQTMVEQKRDWLKEQFGGVDGQSSQWKVMIVLNNVQAYACHCDQ